MIYYGGKIQAMGALRELLAKPDAVRITTPALPRETMERVLEIIRSQDSEIVGLVPEAALQGDDLEHLRLKGFDGDRQILERLIGD